MHIHTHAHMHAAYTVTEANKSCYAWMNKRELIQMEIKWRRTGNNNTKPSVFGCLHRYVWRRMPYWNSTQPGMNTAFISIFRCWYYCVEIHTHTYKYPQRHDELYSNERNENPDKAEKANSGEESERERRRRGKISYSIRRIHAGSCEQRRRSSTEQRQSKYRNTHSVDDDLFFRIFVLKPMMEGFICSCNAITYTHARIHAAHIHRSALSLRNHWAKRLPKRIYSSGFAVVFLVFCV